MMVREHAACVIDYLQARPVRGFGFTLKQKNVDVIGNWNFARS
jgi:hypothetical protein